MRRINAHERLTSLDQSGFLVDHREEHRVIRGGGLFQPAIEFAVLAGCRFEQEAEPFIRSGRDRRAIKLIPVLCCVQRFQTGIAAAENFPRRLCDALPIGQIHFQAFNVFWTRKLRGGRVRRPANVCRQSDKSSRRRQCSSHSRPGIGTLLAWHPMRMCAPDASAFEPSSCCVCRSECRRSGTRRFQLSGASVPRPFPVFPAGH